jgi:hypothetical protein
MFNTAKFNEVLFNAERKQGLIVSVFDSITITESLSLRQDYAVSVYDGVGIGEGFSARPDALYLFTYEPFSVLVTEHNDTMVLTLEVGVVMEAITVVNQIAEVSLDGLNLNSFENIQVLEDVENYLDNLSIGIAEALSVNEDLVLFATAFTIYPVDDITIGDEATISLDVLCVNILEQFHVLITESTDILDLVVEVGVVMEGVSVNEDVVLSISVLCVDTDRSVAVNESIALSLDILSLDISHNIIISEQAGAYLTSQNFEIYDDVNVSEDVTVLGSGMEITGIDTTTIIENINIEINELFIICSSNITTIEQVSASADRLVINVDNLISVIESIIIDAGQGIYRVEDINIEENAVLYFADYSILLLDNISIAEEIIVSQNLNLDIQETVTIAEEVNLEIGISISVVSDVSVGEDISVTVIIVHLNIFLGEVITLAEYGIVANTRLYVNVVDAFGVLITEHVDVVDLVVEVGVVADRVEHISSWVYLSLDVLVPLGIDMPYTLPQHKVDEYVALLMSISVAVSDSVGVGEQAQGYEGIALNVNDHIIMQEAIAVVRDYEIIKTDNVYVVEDVTVLETSAPVTFNINVIQQIFVTDEKVLHLDELFLFILDQITVSEYFNLIDLVVEIDLLIQTITITESASATVTLQAQLSFSVFDSVSFMGQYLTFGFTPLEIQAFNAIEIIESVELFDIVIELEVSQNITVFEFVNVPAPFEGGDIDIQGVDDIVVEEFAQAYPIVLRVLSIETIDIEEDAIVDINNLWLAVFSGITVIEDLFLEGWLAVDVYNLIHVVESVYARNPDIVERPPYMFNFNKCARTYLFDYKARDLTFLYQREGA